ncbi:MAG TPA: TetR family transcriptional regulator [Nocardioidaceae bacterium]|nr:TetR family transcriptional regulator [Nocardioidaceae bacterium]
MSAPAFYDELRALRLERLLDASVAIITEEGWDKLTMTRVAERSGVPRQSLYKEVGTKSELGEAVVQREVGRFLAGVRQGIESHPDSVVEGLTAAARFALEYGEQNAMLKAIVQPGHDPELLALLTVRPEAVLSQASALVSSTLQAVHGASGPKGAELEALVDSMVRLTLSHLLQVTGPIDVAVERIGRAVSTYA